MNIHRGAKEKQKRRKMEEKEEMKTREPLWMVKEVTGFSSPLCCPECFLFVCLFV